MKSPAERLIDQLIEKEKKRWELVLALTGNPKICVYPADEVYKTVIIDNAKRVSDQADAIIKQMENEK